MRTLRVHLGKRGEEGVANRRACRGRSSFENPNERVVDALENGNLCDSS